MQDLGYTISTTVTGAIASLVAYLPRFLGGLVILLIGLVVASLLKEVVERLFRYLNLDRWLGGKSYGRLVQIGDWPTILAEVVRWSVVILFLIPAVDAWGLPQVTSVLNELLLYIPNVFVAVIVGYVGLALANLASQVVRTAAVDMGSTGADLLSSVARYAIVFFTALVVLNQLGVAQDLVRILFTGIVAMLALAGGLAFGLGGQEKARRSLEGLNQKIKEEKPKIEAQLRRQASSQPRNGNRGGATRRGRR